MDARRRYAEVALEIGLGGCATMDAEIRVDERQVLTLQSGELRHSLRPHSPCRARTVFTWNYGSTYHRAVRHFGFYRRTLARAPLLGTPSCTGRFSSRARAANGSAQCDGSSSAGGQPCVSRVRNTDSHAARSRAWSMTNFSINKMS